jgi:hypothetical protein
MHDNADSVGLAGAAEKPPQLLTAQQLADRMNVSIDVVYRHSSDWPCVRIGQMLRFDYDQVIEHLKVQTEAS